MLIRKEMFMMAGLIPFNRRRNVLSDAGLDFYDMIDDFFGESWQPGRSLVRDTFKIDVRELENEYLIEAEMPGVSKEEIDLSFSENGLMISVNRQENINEDGRNYIHRERRTSSMTRSVRLPDASPDGVKAKLTDGVLSVTVAKREKKGKSSKIDIE